MSKLYSIALAIAILPTITIAEPNQLKTTEVQQGPDLVAPAESQQVEPEQLKIYKSLDNKIMELEKGILQTKEELDKKLDYQMRCNETAINSVNTSISGASYAIMSFGILGTLLGVGLGIYIARQVRNVAHIANQSKSALSNHLQIRDEVRILDEKIKNNMGKLYDDLKEEETRKLVKRLSQVPEDISNLGSVLVSRDIPKELFPQMKKAYQSLSDDTTGSERKYMYRTVFFQHFPGLAMFDEDLQTEMENDYLALMQFSFKNDILKTSEQFIKVVIQEDNILEFSEKIKKYFIALQQSDFLNYSKLHEHLYNILATKENRFALYSILQQDEQPKDIRKIYGQFLLASYKDASGNTGAEERILNEIIKSIEMRKEHREPEPEN